MAGQGILERAEHCLVARILCGNGGIGRAEDYPICQMAAEAGFRTIETEFLNSVSIVKNPPSATRLRVGIY